MSRIESQKICPETLSTIVGPVLNRRRFLQAALATGISLTVPLRVEATSIRNPQPQIDHNKPISNTQISELQFYGSPTTSTQPIHEENRSLFDTFRDTSLLMTSEFISAPILSALKIPVGNALLDGETMDKIMKMPYLKMTLLFGGVSPVLEETLFRALPNFLFWECSKNDNWQLGLPVSILFALYHNITTDKLNGRLTIAKNKIPLYQFINGLFFWKMIRERGFPHAVAAHGTINTIALSIGKIFARIARTKSYAGTQKDLISF